MSFTEDYLCSPVVYKLLIPHPQLEMGGGTLYLLYCTLSPQSKKKKRLEILINSEDLFCLAVELPNI